MHGLNIVKYVLFLLVFMNPIEASTSNSKILLCPKISSLFRNPDTLLWESTQTHWQSFETSFSTNIHRFRGAQWQGVQVGSVFCLYEGDSMTFLIKLQYDQMIFQPSGYQWKMNQGGYLNCISNKRSDCPFMPKQHPIAPTDIDIHNLQNLKNQPKNDNF